MLELVGFLDQRNYRVRQLPGLSRVWVSRHVARDRDAFSAGSVRLWDVPHWTPVGNPSRNERAYQPRLGILIGSRFGGAWTSGRYRFRHAPWRACYYDRRHDMRLRSTRHRVYAY